MYTSIWSKGDITIKEVLKINGHVNDFIYVFPFAFLHYLDTLFDLLYCAILMNELVVCEGWAIHLNLEVAKLQGPWRTWTWELKERSTYVLGMTFTWIFVLNNILTLWFWYNTRIHVFYYLSNFYLLDSRDLDIGQLFIFWASLKFFFWYA